eukprot:5368792-Karenia_brevis.AAC.1
MTRIAHNMEPFRALELLCDNQHEHMPWGMFRNENRWHFATREETQYPVLLCQRMAALAKTCVCKAFDDHALGGTVVKNAKVADNAG